MPELEPCPWGCRPIEIRFESIFDGETRKARAFCSVCGASGPTAVDENHAAVAWNYAKRPYRPDKLIKAIEAMRIALEAMDRESDAFEGIGDVGDVIETACINLWKAASLPVGKGTWIHPYQDEADAPD